jgi:hypothetical protein
MSAYGLGRLPAPDQRDKLWPMRAVLPPEPLPLYRYWPRLSILDQGQTGTCVAHAWMSLHQGSPIRFKADPAFDAFALYRKIVLQDEWPENDGEATAPVEQMQSGTSVRAGAKACQALGWLSGYVWAQSLDDIVRHVALRGPVVVGFTAYESIFSPDAKGFVGISGRVVGGHAWVIDGINRTQGSVRCRNSWGRAYARGGLFWMTLENVERLLREDGEACAPSEQVTSGSV